MTENKNISFEAAMKELEKTVLELEKGEQALEQQLKVFERGIALSRECVQKLDEIERRVEVLVQSDNGELKTQNFQANLTSESVSQ